MNRLTLCYYQLLGKLWRVTARFGKAGQGMGCLQRSPDSKSLASGGDSHFKAGARLGKTRLGQAWEHLLKSHKKKPEWHQSMRLQLPGEGYTIQGSAFNIICPARFASLLA